MTILRLIAMLVVTVGLAGVCPGRAADATYGTAEEAQALVKRGIDHVRAVGPTQAFADFNDHTGAFVDRDLYLIVTDLAGVRLAHGSNLRLVGRSIVEFPDAAGVYYGREIVRGALSWRTDWVDYIFADPLTGRLLPKRSYYERYDDFIVYCGVYRRSDAATRPDSQRR